MKIFSLLIVALFIGGSLAAQERIVPLSGNATLSAADFKIYSNPTPNLSKDNEMVELPFVDDFSADRFPGNEDGYTPLWTNRTASINTGWGKLPPTVGVVSLDGADAVGYPYDWTPGRGPADTLESSPINLAGNPEDGFGISFYYQPQGNAYFATSPLDSLMLDFYAPELDQWFPVWSTSDVSNPDTFTFVYIPIEIPKYLKAGFKFRFTNIARLQGALSTWNLDYIWVDQNNTNSTPVSNDVAFVRQEATFLEGLTAMPRDHFAQDPASHMRESIHVLLRNLNDVPRTLEGNKIRILYDGVEIGSYANSNNPSIGTAPNNTLDYLHTVAASPNNIVFDPSYSDTQLDFQVQILHGVSDFPATETNDTIQFTQSFFTHYAYDDGHAEAGYNAPDNGAQVAMRFTNFKSDSIFALQIYTMPTYQDQESTAFTIRVWEDSGDGPGALLGETQLNVVYGLDGYQQQWIYFFEEPIYVPSGSFFCGYKQSSQPDGISIGLDLNRNFDEENLYYTQDGNWQLSTLAGTVQIHPMFTSNGYEIITGIDKPDIFAGLRVYPNPAHHFFNVRMPNALPIMVSIYDLQGRLLSQKALSQNGRVAIHDLKSGAYMLVFEDKNGNRATRKLLVAR